MIFNNREIKPYKIIETKDEIINKSNKDPKILITDFDDTLTLSTSRQLELILNSENRKEYEKYFNLRNYSDRFLLDRTEYYTWKWLQKNKNQEIPQEIINEFNSYFSYKDFYKDIKPTKFAIALKEYLNKPYCKKIYVVSHILNDIVIDYKINWLMNYFKDNHPEKIEFIPVYDTKKSIPVNELNIKWDIFADDRLECIYDMVLYGQGFGNEILIPKCGYNKPTERFTKLVENFNLQTYYIDII